MSQLPSSQGLQGLQLPNHGASRFNAVRLAVLSVLSRIATSMLVEVMGVTNNGDDIAAGTVDIRPLVNQVDGDGNAIPHGTIYGCPYMRLQGGSNAVILDPQVGDIGLAVFTSRDISSVIANKAQSNPGSKRMFDWADGCYIGGYLNGVPTQFVQFDSEGITVKSPSKIKLQAPDIELDCQTMTVNATTAVNTTTPESSLMGNAYVSEVLAVDGVVALFGAVTAHGNVSLLDGLTVNGVDMSATHQHNLTGGGHTLGVKTA